MYCNELFQMYEHLSIKKKNQVNYIFLRKFRLIACCVIFVYEFNYQGMLEKVETVIKTLELEKYLG